MPKKTDIKRRTKSRGKPQKKEAPVTANPGRRYELLGLAYTALAVVALCGLFGWNVGWVGLFVAKCLHYIFGVGAIPAVLFILLLGWQYMTRHRGLCYSMRFFGLLFLFCTLLAIWHHIVTVPGAEILPESLPNGGGFIGGGLLLLLRRFFGIDGALILLCFASVASILVATSWSLSKGLARTEETAKKSVAVAGSALSEAYGRMSTVGENVESRGVEKVRNRVKHSFYDQEKDTSFSEPSEEKAKTTNSKAELPQEFGEEPESTTFLLENEEKENTGELPRFTIEYGTDQENVQSEACSQPSPVQPSKNLMKKAKVPVPEYEEIAPIQPAAALLDGSEAARQKAADVEPHPERPYVLPDITEILSKTAKKKNVALEIEIEENARVLQKTLEDFRVSARIVNACHGPAVTRYELEPAPGVKVSKITNLADDIALALAASAVRIEPIPGKAAIGIEVPNKELEGVQLREVLEKEAFQTAKSKLTVGLGIDIGGKAIFADLAKMPHLLVAGATGSGKSVCVNTLITSILFKAKPDEVKFILVDPKMVELSNYNGIPHLMVPVVTEAKKAASVLNWSVQEMEKRYTKFANCNVRNMETYNKKFPDDKMPAIVIIIDELADLMMVAPHDVEDAICRLAQKARAAGIHMVLATQRPSVDVITGIIKANIPSRISFAVSSQVDSRTILDRSGAEKLLGKGDMLFFPIGASKPQRVQGAFVSDEEVEKLLDFIRSQGQEMETNEEIVAFTENAMKEESEEGSGSPKQKRDELLPEAVELVMSTGQASTSSIQRRFRVGYTRAARLIDEMEALGIVGPNIGSKPREILMTSEEAESVLQSIAM